MAYTGKDLIEFGFTPGPHFGPLLAAANKLESEGMSRALIASDLLTQQKEIIEAQEREEVAKPHMGNSRGWYSFIPNSENEAEKKNLMLCMEHMDEISRHPRYLQGALMPDAHPAGQALGTIPVGGVVVLDGAICPDMHSADVCCSMNLSYLDSDIDPMRLLDVAVGVTHFGPSGRDFAEAVQFCSTSILDRLRLLRVEMDRNRFTRPFLERACNDFMTQGDGNHFISFGRSQASGETTILTHHGSRSLGAKVYQAGAKAARDFTAKNARGIPDHLAYLPLHSTEGIEYFEALQLIQRWVILNHAAIHNSILNVVHPGIRRRGVFNAHNFVFQMGDGKVAHAKGATPAMPEHLPHGYAIIPMNMAEPALVVRPDPLRPESALGFAPHGAGRNMSRKAYKASVEDHKARYGRDVGNIDMRWYLGHPDLSECASAYKPAHRVERAIEKWHLADIADRIIPAGCMMAGSATKEF